MKILPLFTLLLALPAWADHSWGPYHWERSANPVTVELGDNVDSRWDGWLAEASTDWSASAALETPIAPGKAEVIVKGVEVKRNLARPRLSIWSYTGSVNGADYSMSLVMEVKHSSFRISVEVFTFTPMLLGPSK